MFCTPAARKSSRQSRALFTGFSDAGGDARRSGRPARRASSMNEPSASPFGVQAPPMRTSGPCASGPDARARRTRRRAAAAPSRSRLTRPLAARSVACARAAATCDVAGMRRIERAARPRPAPHALDHDAAVDARAPPPRATPAVARGHVVVRREHRDAASRLARVVLDLPRLRRADDHAVALAPRRHEHVHELRSRAPPPDSAPARRSSLASRMIAIFERAYGRPAWRRYAGDDVDHERARRSRQPARASSRCASARPAPPVTPHSTRPMRRGASGVSAIALQLGHRGVDGAPASPSNACCTVSSASAAARSPTCSCSCSNTSVYSPVDVAAARLSEADVVAHHRLQLERDVLDDVRRVGAAAQADDEPAALADRAAMLDRVPASRRRAASMKPGTLADEISSYAPTARSMRVTGRSDQKFLPRVACSVVMRISVAATGGVVARRHEPCTRALADDRQRRRHLVGVDDEQVVLAEQVEPAADRLALLVERPRSARSHARRRRVLRVSSSAISPGSRPRRSMSSLMITWSNPRAQPPARADVVVAPVARHGEHAEPLLRRRVPHELHEPLDRRRVVRVVHEHASAAAHADHVQPARRQSTATGRRRAGRRGCRRSASPARTPRRSRRACSAAGSAPRRRA